MIIKNLGFLGKNWIDTHEVCTDEFSKNQSGSWPKNSRVWSPDNRIIQIRPFMIIQSCPCLVEPQKLKVWPCLGMFEVAEDPNCGKHVATFRQNWGKYILCINWGLKVLRPKVKINRNWIQILLILFTHYKIKIFSKIIKMRNFSKFSLFLF